MRLASNTKNTSFRSQLIKNMNINRTVGKLKWTNQWKQKKFNLAFRNWKLPYQAQFDNQNEFINFKLLLNPVHFTTWNEAWKKQHAAERDPGKQENTRNFTSSEASSSSRSCPVAIGITSSTVFFRPVSATVKSQLTTTENKNSIPAHTIDRHDCTIVID